MHLNSLPTEDMLQQPTSVNHRSLNGTYQPVLQFPPPQKQRVTVSLPTTLIERLRNAVYWTGPPSLVILIAEALETIVTEMEEVNGGPFPPRLSPLKPGRRQGKRASAPSTVVSYRKSGT